VLAYVLTARIRVDDDRLGRCTVAATTVDARGPTMTGQQGYAFHNAHELQRERLQALEAALDAGTIRVLRGCGITPGWRCLEVGAGGGSIADWMCEQVGTAGGVVATDLDTTVLQARSRPNLDIRVHDVLADELPRASFDLVHMRLLLAWLPERRAVLERVLRALKPGGRLVVEELDFASVATAQAPDARSGAAFERVLAAHLDVLRERSGFDSSYGRRLPADMRSAGVDDVRCEGRVSLWADGNAGMRVWRLTFVQLRDAMLAAGTAAHDIDRAIKLCDEPGMSCLSPLVMAGWGRAAPASRGR
jgi:SAM-dependent methyltransferase